MNRPDNIGNGPADRRLTPPSPGQYIGMRCARCDKTVAVLGSKWQRVRGARVRVCKGCAR